MTEDDYGRFAKLTFDDFRRMAQDDSLSRYEKIGFPDSYREGKEELIFRRMAQDDSLSRNEKIGFPDSYREGKEELIFQSIAATLPLLNAARKVVLDIGPGCSELPRMLIGLCRERGHKLLLVDSEEMLSHLPNDGFVQKYAAYYPQCESLFEVYRSKVDVIVAYSVLHHVFAEGNVWDFLDRSLELLAEGGEMLIGDVPNISKRRRFFSSAAGIRFHQQFTNSQSLPEVNFNRIERQQIDDCVVLAMLSRARNQGFDAYVLPQSSGLPMANRREDLLIRRP